MLIKDYKESNKGALVASFTVQMTNGLYIHDMKLFKKDTHLFVNFPSKEYEVEKDGKKVKKYWNYVGFIDMKQKNEFEKQIIELINAKKYEVIGDHLPKQQFLDQMPF